MEQPVPTGPSTQAVVCADDQGESLCSWSPWLAGPVSPVGCVGRLSLLAPAAFRWQSVTKLLGGVGTLHLAMSFALVKSRFVLQQQCFLK